MATGRLLHLCLPPHAQPLLIVTLLLSAHTHLPVGSWLGYVHQLPGVNALSRVLHTTVTARVPVIDKRVHITTTTAATAATQREHAFSIPTPYQHRLCQHLHRLCSNVHACFRCARHKHSPSHRVSVWQHDIVQCSPYYTRTRCFTGCVNAGVGLCTR